MAYGANPPFQSGNLLAFAAGAVSAVSALPGTGESVIVTNLSASIAYVFFSTDPSAVAVIPAPGLSVAGGLVVLSGAQRVCGCPSIATQVAAILAVGSGTLLIERGNGSAR